MRYKKKPVIIEAFQWFTAMGAGGGVERGGTGGFYIATLEGPMTVSDKDWIITGIKGEKYPCKPDIFEATYEAVPDGN